MPLSQGSKVFPNNSLRNDLRFNFHSDCSAMLTVFKSIRVHIGRWPQGHDSATCRSMKSISSSLIMIPGHIISEPRFGAHFATEGWIFQHLFWLHMFYAASLYHTYLLIHWTPSTSEILLRIASWIWCANIFVSLMYENPRKANMSSKPFQTWDSVTRPFGTMIFTYTLTTSAVLAPRG